MKKFNKKAVVSLLGAALMVAAVGATGMSAAAKTGTTQLGYDRTSTVVPEDPSNPDTSKWAVSIPSNVEFLIKGEARDMTVELKAINGTDIATLTKPINVTVASANTWKLKNDTSTIDYALTYDSKTNAAIGTLPLTGAAPKQVGTVILSGDETSATLTKHTDTLTYTITPTT